MEKGENGGGKNGEKWPRRNEKEGKGEENAETKMEIMTVSNIQGLKKADANAPLLKNTTRSHALNNQKPIKI